MYVRGYGRGGNTDKLILGLIRSEDTKIGKEENNNTKLLSEGLQGPYFLFHKELGLLPINLIGLP